MKPALLLALISIVIPACASAVSVDAVDRAIAHAKEWLYKQQTGDNWEKTYDQHGDQKTGGTAVALYALLASGENHNDERIVRGVEYLRSHDTTGTYALGVRCNVWLLLPQTAETKAAMAKDAKILESSLKRAGEGKGFYGYNPDAKAYSHSRAQYGVLGMWAAAQAGIEVPDTYWQTVEQAWIADQDPSGAWCYYGKPTNKTPLTPGMTAVGVATLFITQEYLHANDGIACRGNIRKPAIDKGLKWITDNFDKVATDKTYDRDFPYSTLYAIERIGVASGYKYFNDVDWYEKGAAWLIKNQHRDGSWPEEFKGAGPSATCLAILFLSRGRAPVALSKLDFTSDPAKTVNWNQRPRDAANVCRWIGRQLERDINWQVVNLSAPVADLHDSPILYLAGNDAFELTSDQKSKLKQFVEEGGMLLGNADCGGKGFSDSFRKLGGELFPQYEFRELPEQHPIYTTGQFPRAKWKTKPSVLGLSNGVRELMLCIPAADPAKSWQLQLVGGREEMWQLAADTFSYAVDQQGLRVRGETYTIDRNTNVKATKTIRLVRLEHNGNPDPEPGGWKRLSNLLHNRYKLDLDIKSAKLGPASLGGAKVAHLTGTGKIKIDDVTRLEIKQFIDAGGTMVIDAAGGSSDFAQSIESEINSIYPDGLKQLPRDHLVYQIGDKRLQNVRYRSAASSIVGKLKDTPRVQGVEKNGRVVLFYSREDLTAGLVGQAVGGIVGYDPETATDIMTRILLYAAGERTAAPPPATRATTKPSSATTKSGVFK